MSDDDILSLSSSSSEEDNDDDDHNEMNDQQMVIYYINLTNPFIHQSFIRATHHPPSVIREIERHVPGEYRHVPNVFSRLIDFIHQKMPMPSLSYDLRKFNFYVLSTIHTIVTENGQLSTWDTPGRRLIVILKIWGTNATKDMIDNDILSNYEENRLWNYIHSMPFMNWNFPNVYNNWIIFE